MSRLWHRGQAATLSGRCTETISMAGLLVRISFPDAEMRRVSSSGDKGEVRPRRSNGFSIGMESRWGKGYGGIRQERPRLGCGQWRALQKGLYKGWRTAGRREWSRKENLNKSYGKEAEMRRLKEGRENPQGSGREL